MPDRRLWAVLAAVVCLAGCGTTVPNAASGTTGFGADGQGLAPTGTASYAITPRGTGPTASTPGASPLGGTLSQGSVGSTAHGGGPGSPGVDPAGCGSVRSAAPVRVGLLYIDGADALASSLGVSGLTTGDTRAQAKAVVAYLNTHGGLAGHPIDLREGRLSASQMASDSQAAHAQACSSLVEDEKVSYVISYVQLSSTQLACYAKHRVTVLDDQSSVLDTTGARYASFFGSPGELALGRAATELVDALWRTKWLTPKSKIGTYVYDTSDGAALEEKYLVPALAHYGLTASVKIRASDGADGANQSATVVKMASQGVDRVIPIGANPLFLMNAAESQNYRPAYAMTSTFGPGALLESSAPRNQLKDAAGIGWSKYLDIGAGTKPPPVSANETLCFAIMRKAGQQASSATPQALQAALCNVLMFLQSAANAYGVSPDLLDQVRTRGLAFPPADAFAIRMQPGRGDGVAAYRDLRFDERCGCFQYRSGNQRAN